MAEISRDVLENAGLTPADIDIFIPHQANQRITEAVADRLNVDSSKVYSNIAVHGNTSSASIPIALDECVTSGRIKEGDLVMMTSFGGGVTWGGVLVRW
jgi:3-oxoacyl-[acyl-carrier-protein] synthase-3